jgi:hypothetical protein
MRTQERGASHLSRWKNERRVSRMAKVIFGNHMSVIVPRKDRDEIRKFYCEVLGAVLTRGEDDRDFLRLGDDFYVFLYGDVPDASEFLRTARSVWLEIQCDNVDELAKRLLHFGVRKLEVPDAHLYFQAPGGQCFRLVGIDEDLSSYEGAESRPGAGNRHEVAAAKAHLEARAGEGKR